MDLKPGTIPWARQALLNAEQACGRASIVLLANGMAQEAYHAQQIREAAEMLAARITPAEPPQPRSAA